MIEIRKNNKYAIIILHEIYGVNQFIKDVCISYSEKGFDVFCPEMYGQNFFQYADTSDAYRFFQHEVGFDYYKEIERVAESIEHTYDKIFILGFSVGATIAWRCCENNVIDGIVCCYGSRIRDYLFLQPCCPVLLLFAERDSFDVDCVMTELHNRANVEIYKFMAGHGFMDKYSDRFDTEQEKTAKAYIDSFISHNRM